MLGLMDGNDRGERATAPGAPRQTRGSVPIGRIWHVEIRLHWTFLALLFLVLWLYSGAGRRAVAADLLWIAAIFGSVLVHELAHCVVARRRGAVVDDILLTPLGGLSQLHEMPEAPGDELAIAIVGPLTNFVLAVGLTVGGLVTGARLWAPTLFAGSWFARLLWMNVLLGAFNLLPALPMDGGRVLRAALARRYDRYTATAMAAHVARVCAGTMILIGFLYDFWLILIGIFVLLGASAEEQGANSGDRHPRDPGTKPPGAPPPIGTAGRRPEGPPGAWWPQTSQVPEGLVTGLRPGTLGRSRTMDDTR